LCCIILYYIILYYIILYYTILYHIILVCASIHTHTGPAQRHRDHHIFSVCFVCVRACVCVCVCVCLCVCVCVYNLGSIIGINIRHNVNTAALLLIALQRKVQCSGAKVRAPNADKQHVRELVLLFQLAAPTYACVYVYVYVYVYAYAYVCLYNVCVCVCVYKHTHKHTRTHILICLHAHAHMHTHTHTYARTHTHTHTQTHTHTRQFSSSESSAFLRSALASSLTYYTYIE
jgi:hypothetical protein